MMIFVGHYDDQGQSIAVELFNSDGELVGSGHAKTGVYTYIQERGHACWARLYSWSGDCHTFAVYGEELRVMVDELDSAFQESASILDVDVKRKGFSRGRRMSVLPQKSDVVLADETRLSLHGAESSELYVDDHRMQANFLMEEQAIGKLTLNIVRGRVVTKVGLPGDAVSVAVLLHEVRDGAYAPSLSVRTSSPEADAITSHMSSGQLMAARCYLDWAIDALQDVSFKWCSVPAALLVRALGCQSEIGAAAYQWRRAYQSNPDVRALALGMPDVLESGVGYWGDLWPDLPAYSAVTRILLQAVRSDSEKDGLDSFSSLSRTVGYLPQSSPFTVTSLLVDGGIHPGGGLPLSVSIDSVLPTPVRRHQSLQYKFG